MTGHSAEPVPRDPVSGQTIHGYLEFRVIEGQWPNQTLRGTGRCLICGQGENHTRHPHSE